jgi:SAM-dependent methyltransferase
VPELSPKEYLDYLLATYADRPETYYRQFLTVPLRDGQGVLDWGCGLGRMLELVSALCPAARLAGVDLNPEVVRFVSGKHPDWDIAVLPPPGLRSPFPEASFDRVFLLDVLEHSREPDRLLAECHRVLKPGGILTLSTPDRLAFHKSPGIPPFSARNLLFNLRHLLGREWLDPTHVTEWSAAGLLARLEASPFARHDLKPVLWHRIPWARPPRRYYAFIVNLWKGPA